MRKFVAKTKDYCKETYGISLFEIVRFLEITCTITPMASEYQITISLNSTEEKDYTDLTRNIVYSFRILNRDKRWGKLRNPSVVEKYYVKKILKEFSDFMKDKNENIFYWDEVCEKLKNRSEYVIEDSEK